MDEVHIHLSFSLGHDLATIRELEILPILKELMGEFGYIDLADLP